MCWLDKLLQKVARRSLLGLTLCSSTALEKLSPTPKTYSARLRKPLCTPETLKMMLGEKPLVQPHTSCTDAAGGGGALILLHNQHVYMAAQTCAPIYHTPPKWILYAVRDVIISHVLQAASMLGECPVPDRLAIRKGLVQRATGPRNSTTHLEHGGFCCALARVVHRSQQQRYYRNTCIVHLCS